MLDHEREQLATSDDWTKLRVFHDQERLKWGSRRFDCPHTVDREGILEILRDWESRDVEAEEIRGFACHLANFGGGLPRYPLRFTPSVWFRILELFRQEKEEHPTRLDIELLRTVLEQAEGDPRGAHQALDSFLERKDTGA